jgi:hypothetical protein
MQQRFSAIVPAGVKLAAWPPRSQAGCKFVDWQSACWQEALRNLLLIIH